MDIEVGIAKARNGNAAEAVASIIKANGLEILKTCPGVQVARIMPGIEHPDNILFLIEWDSIDAHDAARSSPEFQKFIGVVGPYLDDSRTLQHFRGSDQAITR